MSNSERDNDQLSIAKVAAEEEARRNRFIQGGQAEDAPDDRTDKPTGIVSEDEETGLSDPLTGR